MFLEIRSPKFRILCSVFSLIASILFSSCSHQAEQLPSNILSKDKMVAVLVDIHLAEASADNRMLNLQQINATMAVKYKELFEKHGISYDEFKTSYDYYLVHADLLSEIYTEVVNQLSTRDSRVNASRKNSQIVKDSIRNIDIRVPDSSKKK